MSQFLNATDLLNGIYKSIPSSSIPRIVCSADVQITNMDGALKIGTTTDEFSAYLAQGDDPGDPMANTGPLARVSADGATQIVPPAGQAALLYGNMFLFTVGNGGGSELTATISASYVTSKANAQKTEFFTFSALVPGVHWAVWLFSTPRSSIDNTRYLKPAFIRLDFPIAGNTTAATLTTSAGSYTNSNIAYYPLWGNGFSRPMIKNIFTNDLDPDATMINADMAREPEDVGGSTLSGSRLGRAIDVLSWRR